MWADICSVHHRVPHHEMAGASTQQNFFWKFSEVIFSGLNIRPFSFRRLLADCNGKNTMVLLIVACVWMFLQALVIDFCLRSCDITWLLQIGLLQKARNKCRFLAGLASLF